MSIQYGNLCSVIIKQYFGDIVQKVADCLFSSISRTIPALVKATKLPKNEVTLAIAVLIKFQLVTYQPSVGSDTLAEYSLNREEILYIIRYPRFLHLIQTKFGGVAESIIVELIRSGAQTASNLLIKCVSNPENKNNLTEYRDLLFQMITGTYIKRIPVPGKCQNQSVENSIPTLILDPTDVFRPPEIDIVQLNKILAGTEMETKDAGIFWQINYNRFNQDFRDDCMLVAMERKLGTSAAEGLRFILAQTYERTDPWQKDSSNPFTFVEIKHNVEKMSKNIDLIKYLDQYITLIAEDSMNFLRKIGDTGGGQYQIEMKAGFENLALCCIENVITEKFGSKASRIFRVIKAHKFIEQEEIQKEAMIPAKEAKLLTYKLFEEQFIQIKTIRKGGGGGSGPAKSFYLFHVNYTQVVKMLLDICYKAFYNIMTRSNFEKGTNRRLIDKSQKLDSIVQTMKERGESEEYIAEILETLTPPEREILQKVKTRIKTLSTAELAIDDTIFLLQMYLFYHTAATNK